MKFLNGVWLVRDGVSLNKASHVYETHVNEDNITLVIPTRVINDKAGALDIPVITVSIFPIFDDVFKIKIEHFKGSKDKLSYFDFLKDNGNPNVRIEDSEQYIKYSCGRLSIIIKKGREWYMGFFYDDLYLTSSESHGVAYIKDECGKSHIREMLNISPAECIYGLGERFTAFVKNGQTVNMWNEDGGTCTEIAYKNVPFFVSNKGYGVFVNYTGVVSYEIATEVVSKTQFSIQEEGMEYYFIGGGSIKNVLENYTTLTGKPALPPAWSFGLWLSTSFTTDYDENVVNSFIDKMLEYDIPLDVFHFDCFWMKAFRWSGMDFDTDVFKNPRAILKKIKDKDIKICLWINPYIGQLSSMFDEGMREGYFIKKTNGDVWQWDRWQPGMAIVDFTNPYACSWYASKLEKLLDIGVDSFKTDFGERIPHEDVVFYDNSNPKKMHNYYSYLYNKTVFDVLEKRFGKNKAALFARSGTAGGQQFPVHWSGDSTATYESMAETLRGGLSLAMSGYSFWSHDIGGFETTATEDLYKRWVAFGLLSSHSRLHGSKSYRVPWNFDDESVDVLRYFTKLKCKLMPYIFSESVYASNTGISVLRSMVMEFENDRTTHCLDLQYMFGSDILVAPIFNDKGIADYYLPSGKWTSIIDSHVVDGGKWISENHSYMSIAIFARENSIIPIGSIDNKTEYDYLYKIEYHVFQPMDGYSIERLIYDKDGILVNTFKVERNGNDITLYSDNDRYDYSIKVYVDSDMYNLNIKKSEKITSLKIKGDKK